MLNEGWAVHSVYKPGQVMTGGYWGYFSLAPWFGAGRPPLRALCIGSAAGTIPGQLIHFYPRVRVDGVEIDPQVVDIGRKLFGMNEANLSIHVGDGRPFLMTTNNHYDLIGLDAFRQPYIPFYLATREFFQTAASHLTAEGVVMVNVGKVPGDSALADAIAATMRDVFPTVYSFSAGEFNQLLVATKMPAAVADTEGRQALMPPPVAALARQVAGQIRTVQPGGEILTDDKAPVEWLTDQMIIHYATGG